MKHQRQARAAGGDDCKAGPMAQAKSKRKRDDAENTGSAPSGGHAPKHVKTSHRQGTHAVKQPLLAQLYPKIQTLRQYLLSKLPASSRLRRKKIASVGQGEQPKDIEVVLSKLLDSTLVGLWDDEEALRQHDGRREKWVDFSQKGDESYVTLSDGIGRAVFSQSEIVDFVIWLLFSREKGSGSWPSHLLSDGFRKNIAQKDQGNASSTTRPIPGLFRVHPNEHVAILKESPWPELLTLLGKSGESIMIDLLLDCSIFLAVDGGKGNYYQLSGVPIWDAESCSSQAVRNEHISHERKKPFERSPSEITFVRSRMLYARAALNARGLVHFGLRHIHVLNRMPYRNDPNAKGGGGDARTGEGTSNNNETTLHIMMYMFPRQFGLHNVFTSAVDPSQTTQKLQDYTLREEEISKTLGRTTPQSNKTSLHVPKRLRGLPMELVQKLQILHGRCSYSKLLQHYCPFQGRSTAEPHDAWPASTKTASQAPGKSGGKQTKLKQKPAPMPNAIAVPQHTTLTELATPISHVSSFCQAILSKVVPNEFWGLGAIQSQNKGTFMRNVDHFLRLRRFETMSLHEVMQGIKINEIDWLVPPSLKTQKASQTDIHKRKEIFSEFLYYLLDSLLIPLIRSNFYVTESNVHRYRMFFFRHDVWRYIAEPAMAALKVKMFEEVKLDQALRILETRRLGFSQVRLLPKGGSVRPIMNLRRRVLARGGKKVLGPSINSILGPVHTMLRLEKTLDPRRLGSALSSIGDLYKRVKAFKQSASKTEPTYYLAKVDVQAAFDTIPQSAVLDVMSLVPSQSQYKVTRHVEVQPKEDGTLTGNNASKRWHSYARAAGDASKFPEMIGNQVASNRKNTIFVDSVVQKSFDKRGLLALMASHIEQNLVKIGKKYYRQKNGIPQGSVLSSALCNYFYADMEDCHLRFLQSKDCLLLRLVDDFLLITTNQSKASRFVEVMHRGVPEYGVTVSPGKTLVNFELVLDGKPVPRIMGRTFPYCGTRLDCQTLEITKDRDNTKDPVVANSLTVDFSRLQGQNFRRKVLNAFKIQSHLMFFDTSHNSARMATKNISAAFAETATKMWAYAKCMPQDKKPGAQVIVAVINDLVDASFRLLTSKSRAVKYPGYRCQMSKDQVAWLAMHAFLNVLGRKQARYTEVIAWLSDEINKLSLKKIAYPKVVI